MRTKTVAQADKILTAAAQLFASHHFHQARMEDIAELAEVGKGTLYRYFNDKEELYAALLDRASTQLLARLSEKSATTDEPRSRLGAIVAAIIAFFDEHPHLFDLIQRAEVLRGPNFPWKKTRDRLLHLVMELFEEARDREDFIIRDPETAALLLLGGMRAVIRFGKRPRPRDLARRLVDAFLEGNAEKKPRVECRN